MISFFFLFCCSLLDLDLGFISMILGVNEI